MNRYAIIDIDNCIAGDAWRIRYIDWGKTNLDDRYREYHRRAGYDFAHHRHLVRGAENHGRVPIFLTARPVEFREYTERWLENKYLPRHAPYLLVMRNVGDHSPSVDLKRKMVGWLQSHYEIELREIELAVDDRPDVVEMYASLSIPAKVLAIHTKDAYNAPETLSAA